MMYKRSKVVGFNKWVGLSFMFACTAQAVEFSAETLKTVGPEAAYWVTTVTCDNGTNAGEIRRKTDGNEWCASDIEGYCANSKAATAEKVCGAEFLAAKQAIVDRENARKEQERARELAAAERKREQEAQAQAEQERRAQAARAAAEKERVAEADRQKRIKIEETLLEIEQEKLSLRRQELELQRRAVEIREELEGLDAG